MSLPSGFLDELRTRLTLSDIVGRKVTWDRRKSQPGRGDHWAPCPFHQEKTASFHADDRKGFYYCFGCHAKGDVITFVMETENLSFIEAVEKLASEAGMEMPARTRDPRAAETRDRQTRLFEVMEEAVRVFRMGLSSGQGEGARAYIAKRALSGETVARFELGFAADARDRLARHFAEKGAIAEAEAAGLVIVPDDGGAPYDRFRNRLMFPIRDPRGRCIAFGGRALSASAQAKYLNSPETEIFHKGRTLYHAGPAREAAGKAGTVLAAEGYMDVIALAQAGFDHAVAPLGTAITEDQLGLLWKMADEPVIALDGDKAGLRAAERLVDLALPMLAPGRSLRFCLLPEGQDPDDLIRSGGAEAMRGAVDGAIPLVEMLWRREVAIGPVDTPERRAAFDKRLKEALGRIGDESVRAHYAADLRDRRTELLKGGARRDAKHESMRPRSDLPRGHYRPRAPAGPHPATQNSERARSVGPRIGEDATREREATILAIVWVHAALVAPLAHRLEDLELRTPGFAPLLDAAIARIDGEVDASEGKALPEAIARQPVAAHHPAVNPATPAPRVLAELESLIAAHHEAQAHQEAERTARETLRSLAEQSGLTQDEAEARWKAHLTQLNADHAARLRDAADLAKMSDRPRESAVKRFLDELDARATQPKKR